MTLPNIKLNKESFLQGDSAVWMILLALCMISIVEVYSASSRMTYGTSVHFWSPVVEHTAFIIIGLFISVEFYFSLKVSPVRLTQMLRTIPLLLGKRFIQTRPHT